MAKQSTTTTAPAGDTPKTTLDLCDALEFQQGLVRGVFQALDVLLHDNDGRLEERHDVKCAIYSLAIVGNQMMDDLEDRITKLRTILLDAKQPKAAA
jgi:hypothetical protein